jgi:beta-phosphoglucomutase
MKKLKFKPQAVIFDMDGVIVDSMPYHFIAWYEALRPYGVRVTCFDVFAKEGEQWEKSLRYFLRRAGIKPTAQLLAEIFARRRKIFKKNFKRFLFKGAVELLFRLKNNGYLLGLVTGTPLAQVKKILPPRIFNLFEAVITGDRVKKGKPHPQPYLTAACALKLKPKRCLVIENAPFGIESAGKAGMYCVAVTTSLPAQYLGMADMVVDTLEDVSLLIKSCASNN